jgi:dynein heavy chain
MMEDEAFEIEDRINKLPKEAKNWNITEALKGKIKIFRDTNPIMEDLRDVAMRPRHWNLLKSELKEDFRERDEDFTLEKLMSLDLISHADNIAELT